MEAVRDGLIRHIQGGVGADYKSGCGVWAGKIFHIPVGLNFVGAGHKQLGNFSACRTLPGDICLHGDCCHSFALVF